LPTKRFLSLPCLVLWLVPDPSRRNWAF
jgi:hypothetical protein